MGKVTSRVRLIDGIQMVGESGSGHTVVMDGSLEVGGRNMGVRPMELFLIGLGGCASIDVLTILRKGRHIVNNCEVVIKGERAEQDPKVYVEIEMHFVVTGKDIPSKAVERAIQLSEEKYCSAAAMLSKTATIRSTFDIVESQS
ncbi:MAG: OsmC family protein [Magnetococcales bacterium]|nr:OsmC family protein [Magnetococcales bacterium]